MYLKENYVEISNKLDTLFGILQRNNRNDFVQINPDDKNEAYLSTKRIV